jgi:hypothetical protein
MFNFLRVLIIGYDETFWIFKDDIFILLYAHI